MHTPEDEILLSAYLDGELSAEEREHVERLLAEEPDFRQLHDELSALKQQFEALPRHRLPADFGVAVLAAAERQMVVPSHTREKDGRSFANRRSSSVVALRPWLRPAVWSALAVAAALLVMVLVPSLQTTSEVAHLNASKAEKSPAANGDAVIAHDSSRSMERSGRDGSELLGPSSPRSTIVNEPDTTIDTDESPASPPPPLAPAGNDKDGDGATVQPRSAKAGTGLASGGGHNNEISRQTNAKGYGAFGETIDGSPVIPRTGADYGYFRPGKSTVPNELTISVAMTPKAARADAFDRLLSRWQTAANGPRNKAASSADLPERLKSQAAPKESEKDGSRKNGYLSDLHKDGESGKRELVYRVDLTYDELVDLVAEMRSMPEQFRVDSLSGELKADVDRCVVEKKMESRRDTPFEGSLRGLQTEPDRGTVAGTTPKKTSRPQDKEDQKLRDRETSGQGGGGQSREPAGASPATRSPGSFGRQADSPEQPLQGGAGSITGEQGWKDEQSYRGERGQGEAEQQIQNAVDKKCRVKFVIRLEPLKARREAPSTPAESAPAKPAK